jgi:UDP-glucose 4-epimerase
MKILALTGASGFIGKRLAIACLGAGWSVRALVRNPARAPKIGGLVPIAWDATSQLPDSLLQGASAVCHLAAHIPQDMTDPISARTCMDVNAQGTLNLLIAAERAGISRFVNFSSANAYAPSDRPVHEDWPLFPSQRAPYYLASKVAAEIFVDYWRVARGMATVTLRLASVYGEGMKESGVLSLFESRLRRGQEIVLRQGGLYGADFVFVDDVVDAAMSVLGCDISGPVNIGSGRRQTICDCAAILIDLLGADPGLVRLEPPGANPDMGFAALDIGRARKVLNFDPISLSEGLGRYLTRSLVGTRQPNK